MPPTRDEATDQPATWRLQYVCPDSDSMLRMQLHLERLRYDANVEEAVCTEDPHTPFVVNIDVRFRAGEVGPATAELRALSTLFPRQPVHVPTVTEAARRSQEEQRRALDEALLRGAEPWRLPPWVAVGRCARLKEGGEVVRILEVLYGALIRVRYAPTDQRVVVPILESASTFADLFEPAEEPRGPRTAYEHLRRQLT